MKARLRRIAQHASSQCYQSCITQSLKCRKDKGREREREGGSRRERSREKDRDRKDKHKDRDRERERERGRDRDGKRSREDDLGGKDAKRSRRSRSWPPPSPFLCPTPVLPMYSSS